jgi:hypothetical protein
VNEDEIEKFKIFEREIERQRSEAVQFKKMKDAQEIEIHRRAKMKRVNEMLNRALGTYGLQKGQHVKKHTRTDPRTGKKITAGRQGGTGSAKEVIGQGKTVAPQLQGDSVGTTLKADIEGIIPETSVFNPDTLEIVIRNLENSTVEDLTTMADDLFKQPQTMSRGILAELMLKEILRRGLVEKSELENKMDKEKEKIKPNNESGN